VPATKTYPGVYVEEIASGAHTIVGVGTSTTAFVGYTTRGPVDSAVRIANFGEFEERFGGLDLDSDVSYAVRHFFLNGGTDAYVVRVASGALAGTLPLRGSDGTTVVLRLSARGAGVWGNALRVDVDYDTSNPDDTFNLTLTEVVEVGARPPETFRNLSMSAYSPNYAVEVIRAGSNLVEAQRPSTALVGSGRAFSRTGVDPGTLAPGGDPVLRRIAVTINGDGPHEVDIFAGATPPATGAALATAIDTAVSNIKAEFAGFACSFDATSTQLRATAPVPTRLQPDGTAAAAPEDASVQFSNATTSNAAAVLGLGRMNGGREWSVSAAMRPIPNGTLGSVVLDELDFTPPIGGGPTTVQIEGGPPAVALNTGGAGTMDSPEAVRARIETALRAVADTPANKPIHDAQVTLVGGRLRILPGGDDPGAKLVFADVAAATGDPPNTFAQQIGLSAATRANRWFMLSGGGDGTPPGDDAVQGERLPKSGLYALLDVDLFNILCLPTVKTEAVLAEAEAFCNEKRAFLIVDVPADKDTLEEAVAWINGTGLKDKNAAAYWPRIRAADPLQNYRLREFAPSGAVAGVYARTDAGRGVWKAPAGTEAAIRGAQGLSYQLTDPQNGQINPLGLNALRIFPAYGTVVWGARTLDGADQRTSEWKYIPVRRVALFIEESLYRGTQWCVFEPNDEPLWGQIRTNVGAFMHNLFRQGAFQGSSPRDAYLVKCDSETTTQNDIDLGIVNIVVGFMPLKPAEFVVLKISQLAGQVQT
jgi:phage tail sheath protein FI